MKKLAASWVALFLATACSGEREQTPGPQPPPAATETERADTTTVPETPTATETETPAAPAPAPAPKPPLSELQRDAMRTLMSAFNAHDAHKIASLYTPDARVGGVGPSGWTEG